MLYMEIREYNPSDCRALMELFYNTVHTVNAKDYTEEQLNAWATGKEEPEKFNRSFNGHYSLVATEGETIIGFGDIDRSGYLDRLYVHADFQRRGVATAICNILEQATDRDIITHASITAVPFFQKRGYRIVKKQQVERHGVMLTNYIMEKGK